MAKNYIYIILISICLFSNGISAQENKPSKASETIEGLSFYPNPASSGKIYITSKLGLDKEISIYDVLGKLVLQSIITTKELNIAALSSGVYIIKFKEGEATATRKLIVR